MPADSVIIITDGSVDFSGGVNSNKVTTIASSKNPNGLERNELAWLDNASLRDGVIQQRPGWNRLKIVQSGQGKFQGKFMYQPIDADPYHIYVIGGRIYRDNTVDQGVTDLSAQFGELMPFDQPIAYFVQAEKWLIIQIGDGATLPLFWDGLTLRRSIGITTNTPTIAPNVNEIPAAGPMDYFMGRVWYGQGRVVNAGDIVGGPSGTAAENFKDSVLSVTECPLVFGGDGFSVPAQDGIIRGIAHSANLDAALGQGRLFVGTRKSIYALNVPVTRTDWIATTKNTQPLMTVVQINSGWVNDRGIVTVNGDLFYQSLEPAIRSFNQSTRFFGQWANKRISENERRILQYNDRALLKYCSGINFDNRCLQTALPMETDRGVVHKALIPLDFDPISQFNRDKDPNWEGMYEGLPMFQLTTGDFGGRDRAFATVLSTETNDIELWEITDFEREDHNKDGAKRITWIMEFPAYTWGDENVMKKLVGAELWVDRLIGTVDFTMEYRPDGQVCWNYWHSWKKCSPKNSAEVLENPITYPLTPCKDSYFNSMTLPRPDENKRATFAGSCRPATHGYQFQPRLVITGMCRVRGLYLHAEALGRKLYDNLTC